MVVSLNQSDTLKYLKELQVLLLSSNSKHSFVCATILLLQKLPTIIYNLQEIARK
jgi:hypothetical protein